MGGEDRDAAARWAPVGGGRAARRAQASLPGLPFAGGTEIKPLSLSDDFTGSDPRPLPPREPALEECCGGGCTPCVFDRYAEALERYEEALASWLKRHQESGPKADSASE